MGYFASEKLAEKFADLPGWNQPGCFARVCHSECGEESSGATAREGRTGFFAALRMTLTLRRAFLAEAAGVFRRGDDEGKRRNFYS
jgi:hypothetical protein